MRRQSSCSCRSRSPHPASAAAPGRGLRPTRPRYYFLLGRHYESQGDVDEAIAAHKQAIASSGFGGAARRARRPLRAPGPARPKRRHGRGGAEARSGQPRGEPDPRDRSMPRSPISGSRCAGGRSRRLTAARDRRARTGARRMAAAISPRPDAGPALSADQGVRQGHSAAAPGRRRSSPAIRGRLLLATAQEGAGRPTTRSRRCGGARREPEVHCRGCVMLGELSEKQGSGEQAPTPTRARSS